MQFVDRWEAHGSVRGLLQSPRPEEHEHDPGLGRSKVSEKVGPQWCGFISSKKKFFYGRCLGLISQFHRTQLLNTTSHCVFRCGTCPILKGRATWINLDCSSRLNSFHWPSLARTSTLRTFDWRQTRQSAAMFRKWSRHPFQRWIRWLTGRSAQESVKSIKLCSIHCSQRTVLSAGTKSLVC